MKDFFKSLFSLTVEGSCHETNISAVNRIMSGFLFANLAVLPILNYVYGSTLLLTGSLGVLLCFTPILMGKLGFKPAKVAILNTISLMAFSFLMIHMSKGMIEFHFHIFVALAALVVYATPLLLLLL